MEAVESRFRAMGSEVHIVADGVEAETLDRVRTTICELEGRWSRFDPDSDVSRLNCHRGRTIEVHADTIRLFDTALQAYRLTGGRFDPTVLDAIEALGYRQSLDVGDNVIEASIEPHISPGISAVTVDPRNSTIRLTRHTGFDPGAIGKGLAADIAAEQLMAAGASGALVGIGGDLRAIGSAPGDADWHIGVEDPHDESGDVATLRLPTGGGVATSTTRHRRWTTDETGVRHVIDPRTGLVTDTDIESVTVVAANAWLAEAVATAAIVAGTGDGLDLIADIGLEAIVVDNRRTVHYTAGLAVPA